MKKRIFCTILTTLLVLALLAGCGKNRPSGEDGPSGSQNGTQGTQDPTKGTEGPMSADEIIAAAERETYLSGDADDAALYEDSLPDALPVVPALLQTCTPEDFGTFDGDERFFRPVSDDCLILELEPGRTALYEFYYDGSLLMVRGRTVYESKEALLLANADKALTEDDFAGTGYTYHGNVLYYRMSQDAVFAAGLQTDKYGLLKAASAGLLGGSRFWFSKPYEDVVSPYDKEKWDAVLDTLEEEFPEAAWPLDPEDAN